MNRREFLQVMAVAAAGGMSLHSEFALAEKGAAKLYDLPKFGNVSLLHMTDCHAQLLPIYFREPNVNLGFGDQFGKVPHLVGANLLKHFGFKPNTLEAHAYTYLNFEKAAKTYGKVGGFAHLATLVKRMKANRPARCCSTAATPGKAPARRCGPTPRTWSTPARRSASMS
jgi:sulfur-oxidizing protein SoxB